MNGHRGLSQAEASELAADLESQYDVCGAHDQRNGASVCRLLWASTCSVAGPWDDGKR